MLYSILKVTSRIINNFIRVATLIKQKHDIKSIKIKITNKSKIKNHATINMLSIKQTKIKIIRILEVDKTLLVKNQ